MKYCRNASPCTSETRLCDLCLTEKLIIAKAELKTLLKIDQKLYGSVAVTSNTTLRHLC